MGDVHPSILPLARGAAKAEVPGASEEPAFDEAAMCAIMARRAEADAQRRCHHSVSPTQRERILPNVRTPVPTPAGIGVRRRNAVYPGQPSPRSEQAEVVEPPHIMVRVREDDSDTSPVREIAVAVTTVGKTIIVVR